MKDCISDSKSCNNYSLNSAIDNVGCIMNSGYYIDSYYKIKNFIYTGFISLTIRIKPYNLFIAANSWNKSHLV